MIDLKEVRITFVACSVRIIFVACSLLSEDHIRGVFTVMRRKYEAFVTDEDNEQNNRKHIEFEALENNFD